MPIEPSTTHVIILAPATLYQEAWRALLSAQPYIILAGTVSDPSEIGPLEQSGQQTTILVDVPSSQTEVARQLHRTTPECGLLILVETYDLGTILPLLQAGAIGCLSRNASVSELARAIIAVGRGEIALPPGIGARALAALASGRPIGSGSDTMVENMTERETEVLSLLAQGMTNKDIAQEFIVSVRTVEAHLRNIYGKLSVNSRTEAALWAAKNSYGQKK
jgi:NarL family two-component system response regulator LiaR